MKKLIRITTISGSLLGLLKGQLKYLNDYYNVIGVASGNGQLLEVKKQEGIQVKHVKMFRLIHPVRDCVSLFHLIHFFIKERPYIVHANTPKASLLSMIAAWLCRVPHRIYTVTGLRFETTQGWFRKLLIFMERITCACATKVIPEGEGVKKTILKEKITNKPLDIILNGNINGIDTTFFSPDALLETKEELREKLGYSLDDFVFVFVGRMVKDKGINELVASFIRLNRENKQVRLLLVGPFEKELDPLNIETEEAINTHQAIQWVGFQKDVRPYFKVADALAFPSYREGFPNVVLQAGAMGLPSIVTDINGCNEIIIEGENGCIIPPQNEEDLFLAMRQLAKEKEEVKRMASNARSLIQIRYEQIKVWGALLDMYKKL